MASNVTRLQAIMDIELYPNYFLVRFMRLQDFAKISFTMTNEVPLDIPYVRGVLNKYEIITFNGNKYDVPILRLAMAGEPLSVLKQVSDRIIHFNLTPYQIEREYRLPDFYINHIDLIEVAPSQASLKTYGGRLHSKKLQDLPYDPEFTISEEEKAEVETYCGNDLFLTNDLLEELTPQIELRRALSVQYHTDLRSKSDAQIAEEVIKSEIKRKSGLRPVKREVDPGEFSYDTPEFIKFKTKKLKDVLEVVEKSSFIVTHTGRIEMPKILQDLKIKIGGSVYRLGIGGLHSSEESVRHLTDDKFSVFDWDVTSYYPAIILLCRLYPEAIGEVFLEIFQSIVDRRVEAKKAKEKVTDKTLKIVINGAFGKLGSPFSAMFAPKLMIQVTVTGQLSLLMLIEQMESMGLPVVSANTDGIVIKCPKGREAVMMKVIKEWEKQTGFNMEKTEYSGIYSRDVNNYLAIKTDGKIKTKGVFSSKILDPDTQILKKNPQNEICSIAVAYFLRDGVPVEETIRGCKDIRRFLTVRKVNGGALKGGEYLGKTVRWYYGKGARGPIVYKNGNMVARSEGSVPLMELPAEFPTDVNYDWYIREAEELLSSAGNPVRGQMPLFQ